MGRPALIERAGRRALLAAIPLAVVTLLTVAPPAHAVKLYRSYFSSFMAPFNLPFASIGGLAPSPDGAYVYVGSGVKVIQYTASGVWVRTWSPDIRGNRGLATDASGNVLVADKTHGQVQVFDKNEKHLARGASRAWSRSRRTRRVTCSCSSRWGSAGWSTCGPTQESTRAPGRRSCRAATARSPTPPGARPRSASSPWTHGNVYLAGISTQNLEGEGEDCNTLLPKDQYEYWDPLESGEVARYSRTGEVTGWGWLNNGGGRDLVLAPYTSLGQPPGLAVAPDDHNIWVADYTPTSGRWRLRAASSPVEKRLKSPASLRRIDAGKLPDVRPGGLRLPRRPVRRRGRRGGRVFAVPQVNAAPAASRSWPN